MSEIRVSEIRISSNHRELHGAIFHNAHTHAITDEGVVASVGVCGVPRALLETSKSEIGDASGPVVF